MIEEPTHTLIHITDVHLGPVGGTRRDPQDTGTVLMHALQAVEETGTCPTAILFTGDLTESGEVEEYRRFGEVVKPPLRRAGIPAIYLPGNHDDRETLEEYVLGRAPSGQPLDQVAWFGDLRAIALDSTVPAMGYGELRESQMEWLASELATPAAEGTVLALHHPPLPSVTEMVSAIRLVNRRALAEAISGSDVRIILAGHTHVTSASSLAGIPVWTGGAIATSFDALMPGGDLRSVISPSVSRIDLFSNDVMATHVPFEAEPVVTVPVAAIEHMIAQYGTTP
jgi:3',5'-cyclic AMP phosphodiesterase CpdA